MKLAVARETFSDERRVALIPGALAAVRKLGFDILVEAGAGAAARFGDAEYEQAGASIQADRARLFGDADLVVKVLPPLAEEARLIREGAVLLSYLPPLASLPVVRILAERKVSAFSMDLIPRISRAQSMDALSSQATASGYKAVLIAASSLQIGRAHV